MADEIVGVAGMSKSFITYMQRKVQRSQEAFPDDWRQRLTFLDGEVANLLEAVLAAQPTSQQEAQPPARPADEPADEPRAIVQAFALAMERKLAAREYRGSWRNYSAGTAHLWTLAHAEMDEFRDALNNLGRRAIQEASQDALLDARQAVLDEAADVANYLMFVCDVIGALPPTDERGR